MNQEPKPRVSKIAEPSSLRITDTFAGNGAEARAGLGLLVRLECRLSDGTVVESHVNDPPLSVRLGDGSILPGLERGLLGLQTGGRRRLEP